ncbi:hypothetical protein K402DRAFT_335501 [Aulographum hederae CBS 113979]|uniref:Uncharacterized protein n=1 Tax=Aulographum hederae CBS 113979 TaxID=1176131 RepID=A0A6G1GVG5_9PEZI|nr:hypothetical protein K402DRAFT_335501 [Aulographum hederae CBS 113979]
MTTEQRRFTDEINKTSRQLQRLNPPLTIQKFSALRRQCIEETERQLRTIQASIAASTSIDARRQYISQAVELLRQLDSATEAEVNHLELEDPEYARQRGLSILHFLTDDHRSSEPEQWMMISKAWGKRSRTVLDSNKKKLSEYHQQQVDNFLNNEASPSFYYQRLKTSAERQPYSLVYNPDGSLRPRPFAIYIWKTIFTLSILSLVCFYGVGIIATNTRFSPVFQRSFFWVAIFWSLISSSLFGWLTWALGASKRDVMGAFLTAIGLWVVVIQIGQTHLATEAQQEANNRPQQGN